jgi:hypothetical protein
MAMGYLFAEALLHAGKQPTRDSIVAAVQSGGLKGSGLVPLAFSKTDHNGYIGAGITVVHDGVQAATGERWVRDGDKVVPYDKEPVKLLSGGVPSN